eukprot:NODE_3079_length_2096_cov_9.372270.p1 GENE.NODE_3079_length_2096_cov_9.372270~~NODE_3079_length_2096_cov_9.372270.p1  ORF type:complete len:621 (-),score=154.49 NODE_3079_length_2096_cov_9.372270:164-2026(-)
MAVADAARLRVVQRCLADIARHPVEHVDVYLEDDITTWHVALHFPATAPFAGGPNLEYTVGDFPLYVTLKFHEDFPREPPQLIFLSKWINHQHLWGARICHSMLTNDFRGFFEERGTHGTSMWNASCVLADGEGIGGMPRYLQVLREFLSTDIDYVIEEHVRYDQASLNNDAQLQRNFHPEWLDTAQRLEPKPQTEERRDDAPTPDLEVLLASYAAAVRGGAADEICNELHRGILAARPAPLAAHVKGATEVVVEAEVKEWAEDFFLKVPTLPENEEMHPCFDVMLRPEGRNLALATTMTVLCRRSLDLGARTTDFGTEVTFILPYPCSHRAWRAVGSKLAAETLRELEEYAHDYAVQLPCIMDQGARQGDIDKLEDILSIVGELWKTMCIGIVREQGPHGYESERAMLCFVTLHFLLLCLAEEYPGLRDHAAVTTREFLKLIETDPTRNLKDDVPDLGRFLPRFLLTEGDASLRATATTVVRELFNRNVRWVDKAQWSTPGASAQTRRTQTAATFDASQFGMKLTVFQSYYILRSAELGLDAIPALEACAGRPGSHVLGMFQADCRRIKELADYAEFFRWLQLPEPSEQDLHKQLCDAVEESTKRGYNEFGMKGFGKRR